MNDIQNKPNTENEILRAKDVIRLVNISRSFFYRWLANGDIPLTRIKIGPRATGFKRLEVEAWLNGKRENETGDEK